MIKKDIETSDENNNSILTLDFIKITIKEVLNKYNINQIYLFRSYERGQATKNSDVDIYCEKGNVSTLIEKQTLIEEL